MTINLSTHGENAITRRRWLFAGLGVVVAVSGCGSPTGDSPSETTTTSGVTSSTTGVTGSSTPPGLVESHLRGIGQTRAQWDASHSEAPGPVAGDAYLPFAKGAQVKYTSVFGKDRILAYEVYMEPGTTLAEAERIVASELPADAKPGRRRDGGTCDIQDWTSDLLLAETGEANVNVAYSHDDPTISVDKRFVVATLYLLPPDPDASC